MNKEFTQLKKAFDEYMKHSKEELAAMLALSECMGEKIESSEKEVKISDWVKDMPRNPYGFGGCTSLETCTNPQMDCINCPFRGKTGVKYFINTIGTSTFVSSDDLKPNSRRDDFQITC